MRAGFSTLSFFLLFGIMSTVWAAGSGAVPGAEIDAETTRVNAWFDARFEEELSFSPIQQAMLGRKTDYDKIDDMSAAAADEHLAWKRQTVADLKANFNYRKLSPQAQLSWDIWVYQYDQELAAARFRTNEYVFTQLFSPGSFLAQFLITFHRVDNAQDMAAYIARINEGARALDQLVVRAKDSAAHGVRPPRFAFEGVTMEARELISGAPFDDSGSDNAVWQDAKAKIAALQAQGLIDQQQSAAFTAGVKKALLSRWQAAYQRLIDWQLEDIVNAPELASGVGSLPAGMDFYNERLANSTTTALTAAQIHAIGLAEVARIRTEMEALIKAIGFKGDLAAFFALLRDSTGDARFSYPNTDAGRQAYLDDATAAIQNIKGSLPAYFGLLPKADLQVQRVPAFREQPGAAQHYSPSAPDGSRPGIYFVHLADMTAMAKYQAEAIAYHEGIPGHHMQIAIAQELTGIPLFRTQADFTAYSEGWGLYAERLAAEMPGTYQDRYAQFGRLANEMWRAIRLVVDTGLHAEAWTEQQAIDYFAANSPISIAEITSEVRRYLVMPGQATSYKIGMLEILRLRELAQAKLGDEFDIRQFHDTVLGGGALPLALLERRVNAWLASETAQPGKSSGR